MTDPTKEDQNLLDATDVICDIGHVLEGYDGANLAKLHREVCDSEIVYVGDSMFVRDQATMDRATEKIKELDKDA